jgi:predicted nucleotidyltransferase
VSRLVRAYHAAKFRPRSRLGRLLNKHRGEIVAIASKHKASNVRVFGSVARGEDGPSSDIDLLVDLAADADLFDIAGLNVELQRLLGHPVDVVPARMLKPRVALLVHQYADLDPDILQNTINNRLGDLRDLITRLDTAIRRSR